MTMDSSWGRTHLHRQEIFNTMLKEVLRDDLFAEQWVNYIGDFPDGSNYKINSVGELTVDQMVEGTALPDRQLDTGQFIFNINEFVGVKSSFSDVFFEEDFMANQILQALPDRMTRAFAEYLETRVMRLQRLQTTDDLNVINTGKHRFVASGGAGERTIDLNDLAYIAYTLKKANVGASGLVGIVDPSFEFNANILSQVQTSDNPQFKGIIETGFGQEFRFIRNIYGIDLFTSNYLDTLDATETSLFTYDDVADTGEIGDVVNMFFSVADRTLLPFIGAWRRRPTIKSWRDEDKELEYHQLSARFGLNLFRPENLVTIISSKTLG